MSESIERRADTVFHLKRTQEEYNQRFDENIWLYNRKEVEARRLPGDEMYYPVGIN